MYKHNENQRTKSFPNNHGRCQRTVWSCHWLYMRSQFEGMSWTNFTRRWLMNHKISTFNTTFRKVFEKLSFFKSTNEISNYFDSIWLESSQRRYCFDVNDMIQLKDDNRSVITFFFFPSIEKKRYWTTDWKFKFDNMKNTGIQSLRQNYKKSTLTWWIWNTDHWQVWSRSQREDNNIRNSVRRRQYKQEKWFAKYISKKM